MADRAATPGGAAFAAGLGAGAGELVAAGGAAGDPDAAQQVQGRLRMLTTEQAKQSTQAVDLGVCVGLAGLEPATERL
jgi:hypothetical protein